MGTSRSRCTTHLRVWYPRNAHVVCFSLRYLGKGVTQAVENINAIIGPAVKVRTVRNVVVSAMCPCHRLDTVFALVLPCTRESLFLGCLLLRTGHEPHEAS